MPAPAGRMWWTGCAATPAPAFRSLGKVTDVRRHLEGGFGRGHAVLSGTGDWAGSSARNRDPE